MGVRVGLGALGMPPIEHLLGDRVIVAASQVKLASIQIAAIELERSIPFLPMPVVRFVGQRLNKSR